MKSIVHERNMHNDPGGAQPRPRDPEFSKLAIDQPVAPLNYISMVHNVQGSH